MSQFTDLSSYFIKTLNNTQQSYNNMQNCYNELNNKFYILSNEMSKINLKINMLENTMLNSKINTVNTPSFDTPDNIHIHSEIKELKDSIEHIQLLLNVNNKTHTIAEVFEKIESSIIDNNVDSVYQEFQNNIDTLYNENDDDTVDIIDVQNNVSLLLEPEVESQLEQEPDELVEPEPEEEPILPPVVVEIDTKKKRKTKGKLSL